MISMAEMNGVYCIWCPKCVENGVKNVWIVPHRQEDCGKHE